MTDDDTVELENPGEINALSDRQVRNRTLHMIGLQTVALQAIADSVERVASAMEAMTSIPPFPDTELIEIQGNDDQETGGEIAGRMWDQRGPIVPPPR